LVDFDLDNKRMSIREAILAAARLHADVLPERVPPEALLILRDGAPGAADVTLAPYADQGIRIQLPQVKLARDAERAQAAVPGLIVANWVEGLSV